MIARLRALAIPTAVVAAVALFVWTLGSYVVDEAGRQRVAQECHADGLRVETYWRGVFCYDTPDDGKPRKAIRWHQ